MSEIQSTRRHPRNPWPSLVFAALFVLGGAASVYIFIALSARAIEGNMVGRGTELLVLFGPVIFFALAVVALIRGVRAFSPWSAYRDATSPAQRRVDRDLDMRGGNPVFFLGIGILAAAGFVLFLAGFIGWALRGFEDVQSSVFIFEFMVICLILAIAGLGLGGMMLASRRRVTP